MFKKRSQQHSKNYSKQDLGEDMDFDWKDILAFIIAFFQVIFPYVILLFGTFFILMLFFSFWLN